MKDVFNLAGHQLARRPYPPASLLSLAHDNSLPQPHQDRKTRFAGRVPYYCLAHYTIECATCGENFCEGDLDGVDAPWFDQLGSAFLCEYCATKTEEGEDISEGFDEGEALWGQLEIVLVAA